MELKESELGPKRTTLPVHTIIVRYALRITDLVRLWEAEIWLTIFLVKAPEFKMPVALVAVPELVGVCDLGEERSWVFCQRVEEDLVDNESGDLRSQC